MSSVVGVFRMLALHGPVLLHGGVGVLDEVIQVASIVLIIAILLLARWRARRDGGDERDRGS